MMVTVVKVAVWYVYCFNPVVHWQLCFIYC